ncbi:alpha/beta hydrolase [Nocardia yamanashiensis]|uniref:alpha/beta fold hydrolase n=1 Tax=Nocardia yamanashiensis TaxID=209247 RepID=UPI001E2C9E02|nr:alpha/beta hydrolase [Nocardia yamanashiensis]UGT39086.1 alpha/beta hydrolase [Nocardia yamanashiensis]
MTIHVSQDGPADAPALLLIHGTAASGRSWDPMVPLLSGSHRVIRVDLLGCGRSSGLGEVIYTVADQAGRVGAAIDQLGVGQVVAVGHSSGAAVATALAEQRPDLVTAVVIIDFGPDLEACTVPETPSGPPIAWSSLTDDQFRQLMQSAFSPGFRIPQEYVEQFRAIDPTVFAAASQANLAYLNERSLPERLAPLGKPLLVIFGEEDTRWRPSAAVGYRTVPGARILLLPDVGHSPNLEDPQRTAAPLLSFAAQHQLRTAMG